MSSTFCVVREKKMFSWGILAVKGEEFVRDLRDFFLLFGNSVFLFGSILFSFLFYFENSTSAAIALILVIARFGFPQSEFGNFVHVYFHEIIEYICSSLSRVKSE